MSSSGILLKKQRIFSFSQIQSMMLKNLLLGMPASRYVFSNDPRFLQGGILWLEHRAAHLNSQCGSHGSAPEAALRAALVD